VSLAALLHAWSRGLGDDQDISRLGNRLSHPTQAGPSGEDHHSQVRRSAWSRVRLIGLRPAKGILMDTTASMHAVRGHSRGGPEQLVYEVAPRPVPGPTAGG
jgi:hypothetical protein